MFNRLVIALLLFCTSLSAQTTMQGGSQIQSGAVLNAASATSPPPPITVVVTPPTASVGVGTTQNFTATLSNDLTNAGVNWTLTGPSCILATDSFNRPNVNPIDSPPWLIYGVPPFALGQIISNNFVGRADRNPTDMSYDGGLTWPNDQYSQAQIVTLHSGNNFAVLHVRGTAATTVNYALILDATFGGIPGTVALNFFTPAGLVQRNSATVQSGDTFKLQVVGNTITYYQNNNLINTFVDGSPIASGEPGIAASAEAVGGAATDVAWTNWQGGSAGGCGSVSPVSSKSGQTIVFTAPTTLPSNTSINLTATSVADPTKFATATITITQQPPPNASIINFTTNTAKQPAASVLTFPAPTMVGDTPVVAITANDGVSVTSVKDQLNRTWLSVGCQSDTATVGHTAMFYLVGNSQPVTSVVLNLGGVLVGNVDVGYLDMNTGSTSQPDVASVCQGTTTPTTNPLGPAITTGSAGAVVVSAITVVGSTSGIQTPFTFGLLTRGDGMAYTVTNTPALFTPNWTTSNGGWTGVTASFRVGAQPPQIFVSLNPTSSTVQVNKTQVFTNTVTNDTTNVGTSVAVTGAGCAGLACGVASPVSGVQTGSSITYTAPAIVPSPPLVTLTATSIADHTKSASVPITITSAPSITLSVAPTSISVSAGGTAQSVAATLTNDTGNLGVTWALSGPICTGSQCGTLSAVTSTTVNYIPPPTTTTNMSVTLTATAVADTSKTATTSITVTPVITPPGNCQPNCPAFPGAQGGGAAGKGGRGGVAIEVTNLNDSGAGSLRACVQASGARNCVFRVAGLIPVTSGDLRVDNPFLSVDGQTAPGQIILGGPNTNGSVFRISTHDVTIQYVTISPDNKNVTSGPSTGTVGLAPTNCNCNNIVIDHVSTRWAGNKMLIDVSNFVGPNKNITFQNSMLYEPHEGHPVGPGTSGNPIGCPDAAPDPNLPNPCFTTLEEQVDYHHNIFANIDHRIPENDNKSNAWVSNIVFNWSFYANEWLGPSTIDVVNNLFKPGNLNSGAPGPGGCGSFGCAGPAQTFPIHFSGNASSELPTNGGTTVPSVFVSGNICRGDTAPAADQYGRCVSQISGENGSETGPIPSTWKRTTRDPRTFPITQDAASTLDAILLPLVGNSQHLNCDGSFATHRDGADSRIITQYKNGGIGGFWPNGVSYVGQGTIPTPSGTYVDNPVVAGFILCAESLHDGIPDQWKTKYGLSLVDTGLAARTDTKTGFTFYEDFKYGLVP